MAKQQISRYEVKLHVLVDHRHNVVGVQDGPFTVYSDGEGYVYTMWDQPINPERPEHEAPALWEMLETLADQQFKAMEIARRTLRETVSI